MVWLRLSAPLLYVVWPLWYVLKAWAPCPGILLLEVQYFNHLPPANDILTSAKWL